MIYSDLFHHRFHLFLCGCVFALVSFPCLKIHTRTNGPTSGISVPVFCWESLPRARRHALQSFQSSIRGSRMVILQLHHLDQKCSNFQWHLLHKKRHVSSYQMLPVHTPIFEIDSLQRNVFLAALLAVSGALWHWRPCLTVKKRYLTLTAPASNSCFPEWNASVSHPRQSALSKQTSGDK